MSILIKKLFIFKEGYQYIYNLSQDYYNNIVIIIKHIISVPLKILKLLVID